MKKLFGRMSSMLAGLLMVGALAACNQVAAGISAFNYLNGATINQNSMDQAVSAYSLVVLIPFNNYRYTDAPTYKVPRRYCTDARPFALTDPCAKASVINLIQPYIAKSEAARLKVQQCIDANPVSGCPGTSTAIALFKATWDDAQRTINEQVAANSK